MTGEVLALLDGAIDHHGWLVTLESGAPGLGRIYMREAAGHAPKLALEFDTDPGGTTTGWVPPDPEVVAPEPDLTVAEATPERIAFLYEGPDPVQINVTPNAIDDARVGVVRGVVQARSGVLLGDVEVRVVDHPEFGVTKTRGDGAFDIAANGGGPLALEFKRDGLLEVRRRVDVEHNDFVDLGRIVMIAPDPAVTQVDFSELQSVISTQSIDSRGVRQSVVMFREGTVATMYVQGQSPLELQSIDVRATEYTVGEEGPDTMPAPLPQSTGYTYATEFSVDQAVAAGADKITFDPPAISYLDNFLGFEPGTAVPAGTFDKQTGAWMPEEDGIVLKIIGQDGNLARLSVMPDDTPRPWRHLASTTLSGANCCCCTARHPGRCGGPKRRTSRHGT